MLSSNSFTNWSSWVSRHPNEFLLTTGTLITGLATVTLAIITIILYRGNLQLIELNTSQFNKRFVGQRYEELLLLMNDTLKTIRDWISDLENCTGGFIPRNTVRREEVERQRDVAKVVAIKMDLYPDETINPLTIEWMLLLSEEIQAFSSLYKEENRDGQGNYYIAEADRRVAIDILTTNVNALESKREAIAKAMSVKLDT